MKESVLIFFIGYYLVRVNGHIGVTGCTQSTAANCPNFLTNSYCNLGTLFCECPRDYLPTRSNIECEYNCSGLTNPENGAVVIKNATRQGDVAFYACDTTYKINGTPTRTCVQDAGWSGAAPTCEPAKIGDDCSTNISQCTNIINSNCFQFSTCQCNNGYQDDGTGLACSDINECSQDPCQNGATCVDQIAAYTCICKPGFGGDDCLNNIDECKSNPCQNGAKCEDGVNMYTCNCCIGYYGNDCEKIRPIEGCTYSTQLVVLGAGLGLTIIILLVYAGYTTISIRRIRGNVLKEFISSGLSGYLNHKHALSQGGDAYEGHMTQLTEFSSVRNQGNVHNRDGAIETTERKNLIDQPYVNKQFNTEVSANWKHGNKHNSGLSAVLNQEEIHIQERAGVCKSNKSHLFVNEPIRIGASADLHHGNQQKMGGQDNYADIEYFTLDEKSRDNSTYNTLEANM